MASMAPGGPEPVLFLSVTTEQGNGGEHDRANNTPFKRQIYLLELESIMLILPILETLKF